jgi:lambda family phage portal protein
MDVLASQLRLVSLGLNLSYELLSGDLSRVNFSSGRMGSMEDRKHFRRDQAWLVAHFCKPIFARWLETVAMRNEVDIPDFATNRSRYLASVSWKCPGWAWVDPLKEINAHKEALKAGLTTLSEVCSAQGLDYSEVLEQLGHEKEMAKEFGLALDVFALPDGAQQGGGGDEDNDKGGDGNDDE